MNALILSYMILAQTPLNLSNETSSIHGVIEAGAMADVFAYYIPAGTFNSNQLPVGCNFPEDQSLPNGAGKFVKFDVVQGNGQYSLQIPVKGQRGACEYVLETVYLDFQNEKVLQTLAIMTTARVEAMNKDLISGGLTPMEVPFLKDLKKIYCEFNTPESVGLCQTSEGSLPQLNYEIANLPADYVLDVYELK